MAATFSWGIPGHIYGGMCVFAWAISQAPGIYIANCRGRNAAIPNLTPSELGMLHSKEQAVLATLTQLRAGGFLFRPEALGRYSDLEAEWIPGDDDPDPLDLFAREVCQKYPAKSRSLGDLTKHFADELKSLRGRLVDQGLLVSSRIRLTLAVVTAAAIVFVFPGVAELARSAGIGQLYPTLRGLAFILFAGVMLGLPFAFGVPRLTARGNRALSTHS